MLDIPLLAGPCTVARQYTGASGAAKHDQHYKSTRASYCHNIEHQQLRANLYENSQKLPFKVQLLIRSNLDRAFCKFKVSEEARKDAVLPLW